MRYILLTSAASVGLFFTASHVPEAFAQKGVFLSPSSQWAVTKVAGSPSSGEAGYCAVAKRYEGNAILTIARNQGTETSFALDLQKPIFNTANLMKVTLDPGAGEQRDYSISPASQQAFVIRLGRDEAFFSAIDRTGMLRVEAAGKSYVFNISDIADGQTKLNSCLASSVQPAAGSEAPVSFETKVESHSNQEFIAQLNDRIRSLENQNTSLQAKIVDVEREELPIARADTPPSLSDSSLRVEKLQAQNLKLKAELQAGEMELRNDKLALLAADNARLSKELARKSNVSQEVGQLQERVNALLAENNRLKEAKAGLASAEVSSYESNIEQLQAENKSLKVALTNEAQNSDLTQQLRSRIEQIESENRSLKEQVSVGEQAALRLDHEKIAEIQAGHLREVAMLRSKIDDLRLAQTADERDAQKIDVLTEQLASLRGDNLLLKQELQEKEEKIASALPAFDEQDLAALENENQQLQSKLNKAQKTASLQSKAISVLESENASIKGQLDAVDLASVDGLSEKLDALNEALAESQSEQAAQQEQLAALMAENTELKSSLDAKISENLSLASVLDDVSALKEEIASKDEKIAAFDGVPERLQSLIGDYNALKDEKAKLERDNALMAQANESNAELLAKLEDAQALNDSFEVKLAEVQGKVTEMSALSGEVESLKAALTDKEDKLQELASLRDELSQVVAENAALKQEATTLASAQDAAQMSVNKDLAKENIALRRSLSSVIAKAEDQQAYIKEQESTVERVLAKNVALKGQLDLAAQLMASNTSGAADEPMKIAKAEADVHQEPDAKVILASASAVAAPKPRSKPVAANVKKSVQEDVSFAETLAQMEPAAGDEVGPVEEKVAQVEVIETPDIVEDAQEFMDRDLNQAQIYEEQLKRSLNNKEDVAVINEPPVDVEVLNDPVSEDADIDAVISRTQALDELPSLDDDVEQEIANDNAVDDAKEFVAARDGKDEDVEMKMSQDPFEGIAVEGEDAARDVATADAQESFDDIAAMPRSIKQPMSSPVAIEEPMMADAGQGGNAVERVLSMAHISGVSKVTAVADKDGAYQWRTGGLYGSGEQRSISNSAQFDEYVKDYLMKTEARCPGDFAIFPDDSTESGAMRVDSYEIACVGANISSSASLVFYNEGDTFTVLAHETEADKMGQAMSVRDKIFASLARWRDS
ncbi:MAG: hypothetical protein GW778_05865 [Alphaproteobacteria bacterium]|nr:hypothetical protein [Alphaproteobacteria bacterium]